MANEHSRNFSHKGSRTVVPAKIIEIERLVWSQNQKIAAFGSSYGFRVDLKTL
jgi:hypothetical protein